jgi:hypothetical protein
LSDVRRLATHRTPHICHLAYFRELFSAIGHMPDDVRGKGTGQASSLANAKTF